MSWTVDGRLYHDYGEYQAAVRRKNEREASERVAQSQAEARRYQDRLRQQEQELRQAQGDLDRQRQIHEQMRQEVIGLEREQQILANTQARFERDSQAQFGQIRHHMQGMGDQLREAERQHQAHVEATQQAFAKASADLRTGLDNARREREEGEQRLRAAVQQVDDKLEADRRTRVKRHSDDMDQAREQIAIVTAMLDQTTSQPLRPLALEEDAESVKGVIDSATRMLNAGKATVALSQAESAFNGARDLRYKMLKRRAELEAVRSAMTDRIRAIVHMTESASLDEYFKFEKAEVLGYLQHLAERATDRYRLYSRMEDDLREDERTIGRLEEEIRAMRATCTTLAERFENRRKMVSDFVDDVEAEHGGSAGVHARLERPDDPKSDLIVECRLDRGVKVQIVAGIDGAFKVDAAGYATQAECEHHSARMVRKFRGEADVSEHQTLQHNPDELPAAAVQTHEPWRDMSSRLRDIGRSL